MEIMQWAYTRKYQVKCVFREYPSTIFIFRRITDYYFLFTMSGLDREAIPNRHDYKKMEYAINEELGTLNPYLSRKSLNGMKTI